MLAYSNLRTSADSVSAAGEVAELYASHLNAAVERRLKALRGFQRIPLNPNETRAVRLSLKGWI